MLTLLWIFSYFRVPLLASELGLILDTKKGVRLVMLFIATRYRQTPYRNEQRQLTHA